MSSENLFGEAIYSYTRQQAIADGVLVDLAQIETIRCHWQFPVACTAEVWSVIEQALTVEGQDLDGIGHDISMMAKRAIQGAGETNLIFFSVIIAGQTHALKLHIRPGDTPASVLTLMFPNQD